MPIITSLWLCVCMRPYVPAERFLLSIASRALEEKMGGLVCLVSFFLFHSSPFFGWINRTADGKIDK